MGKTGADIFPETLNCIKLCYVCFFVLIFHLQCFPNLKEFSTIQNNTPKICEGDTFQIFVFDTEIPVTKVDSIFFINNNDTLKFLSPNFSGEDTLSMKVVSDTLKMTGDITLWTFVIRDGKPQKRISYIRIVPKIQIISHPIDQYVCQGDLVSFKVNAVNYDAVRWQFLTPENNQWNYYGFVPNPDLNISANKQNNNKYRFRAEFTNEGVCKDYSKSAELLIDTIKPVVICPQDTFIIIDDDLCSYNFAIRPRPVEIIEDCGYNEITTRRSDNKQATEPYPFGKTSVTFLVPDKSGNIGECSYNITIQNNATVKIPCEPNVTLFLDGNCRAQLPNRPLNIFPPCATLPIQVFYAGNINYFQQGNYNLIFYASQNKVERCTTNVTVLDTFRYQLSYRPPDIFEDADPGKCTKIILPDSPKIKNVCTSGRETITLITEWPENNEFLIGETINKWVITRHDGIKDTITQKVIIHDVSKPTVVCPDPVEVVLDPGECSGRVDITPLEEGKACGNVVTTNNKTGTRDASADYPAGKSQIIWTVTHNNNFYASCHQDVTVKTSPLAIEDSVRTSQNEPVTINVLVNDIECLQPDQLLLSISPAGIPKNGTAIVDGQKNILYTPIVGFFGTDSFVYIIENSFGITSEAMVFVTITEVPELLSAIQRIDF